MIRRLWSSTVARIVAAIFALQILSGAATMLLLHSQMLQVIGADRGRQINDLRDDLLAAYYEGGPEGLIRYINDGHGSVSDPLVFVAVTGRGAPVLVHLAQVPQVAMAGKPRAIKVVQSAGGEPADALAVRADLPDGTRLTVGALTAPDRQFDLAFAEAITLTVLLTALLAFGGALMIGLVISRRTHAIAATAEALGSGNFAARIGNAERGDGFDHLRRQMNYMAERIDRLVRELQTVAGTLAHDLRSPVARLKAAIETAQDAVPDGAAADALALARTDAEALEEMLGKALELVRLESGMVGDRRQMLDLAEIAADLAELYEPLAEQSGVSLSCQTVPVRILADRELLSRALANLIDNALKYGGDAITVAVRRERNRAVIEVADNGGGIAEADRGRAVGRFIRLDNARTQPGAGLGLAMVSAVAALHGGVVELDEAVDGANGSGSAHLSGSEDAGRRGLVVRLRLPLG